MGSSGLGVCCIKSGERKPDGDAVRVLAFVCVCVYACVCVCACLALGESREGSDSTGSVECQTIAVGETAILLHLTRPLAGVPTGMEKGRQQKESLADG